MFQKGEMLGYSDREVRKLGYVCKPKNIAHKKQKYKGKIRVKHYFLSKTQ